MIRMIRMHLINWHNFVDDIIDFKNITYLIGLNAVGKTTIIDAIRYCLTTNKEFNTAGNRKSARSLQGSVHQKQRAEESYLRPNHTVTYIGIEFFDESINKKYVISVRVESESPKQELRHVSQDWYISKPGNGLDNMPYFTVVGNNKRPASREEFKLPDRGLEKAPSQAEARRRICRTLGIGDAEAPLGKKFNEVFHMGTSLEDINDIRKFIYTYILPEPEIDVEILHKDMRELERLQEILEEAQEKEKLLKDIMDRLTQAKELDSKIKVNEALVSYAKWQDAKEKQDKKIEEIEEARSNFEKCDILLD
ncbi:ATP-binding protein [Ruminiclostridium cellobioparum]|uniref:ATP-binding protein n=1 Tax=Ruminiclostridium cellobioparum TaxID=29355 RepID=UPI00034D6EED|nr:ATP-binding protein [Ruminiclostridium cellobioparum]